MNIQLAVFDIAGTTVLDSGNVNEAFRQAFLTANINVDAAEINKLMGYKKIEAIKIIIKKYAPVLIENEKLIDDIHTVFIKKMIAFYEHDTLLQPLPYAEWVFAQLKSRGIKVALNTGFTRSITDVILNRLGWHNTPLIDAVVCSDEVDEGRPHPFMIQHLMQKLAVSNPKNIIKIGDTEVDIEEGRNVGCGMVIAVTTGTYSKEALLSCHPDYVIDSLNEIMFIINNQ